MTLCLRREHPGSDALRTDFANFSNLHLRQDINKNNSNNNIPTDGERRRTLLTTAGKINNRHCTVFLDHSSEQHPESHATDILNTLNSTSWAIITTLTALQSEVAMASPTSPTDSPVSSSNSPSDEQTASYPWILDHILSYPSTYEIPLRTMYTLNSSPRAQPLPQQFSRPTSPSTSSPARSPPTSPMSPKFPVDQYETYSQSANDQFRSNLMAQLSQIPTQPCSLPPSFITSFVRRCFAEELVNVDFPQALTALDYLRDLDTRRIREIRGTLGRLGVQKGDLSDTNKLPEVCRWMSSISRKEANIEMLYLQCYIGLRRWVLIQEMSLTPFNKSNCYAMLNTLYPPTTQSQPHIPQLTPEILKSQRDGFWRYIQGVEKNGPDILRNLMHQGRRSELGEMNGWASTREAVDNYLRAANAVIEECTAISGPDYLTQSSQYRTPPSLSRASTAPGAVHTLATVSVTSPSASSSSSQTPTNTPAAAPDSSSISDRHSRKVDSGISFGSSSTDRPSTSGDSKAATASTAGTSAPPSPTSPHSNMYQQQQQQPPPPPQKSLTALEKIAREIRRIREKKKNAGTFNSSAATAEDIADAQAAAATSPIVPTSPPIRAPPSREKKPPPTAFPGNASAAGSFNTASGAGKIKGLRKQVSLDAIKLRQGQSSGAAAFATSRSRSRTPTAAYRD